MESVTLTIDGHSLSVPAGTTILAATRLLEGGPPASGSPERDVPTICYHPNLTANALCRICVVEVSGARTLVPACVALCAEGMVVQTNSERVQTGRRVILELLESAVDCSEAPEIASFSAEYGADPARFAGGATRAIPLIDDNPMYIRDYSKCIMCWRCVQVCAEDAQYTFALAVGGRGFGSHVATFDERPMPETTCVFCGQCVGVCPTGALKPRREWLLEQGKTPDEILQLSRNERRRRRRRDRE